MNKRKIYIEILGLNSNTSKEEIKAKYRLLAKKFHPDRNKESNANEKFLLIKEAYDYLISNKEQVLYFEEPKEEALRMERIRKAKEKLREYYDKEEKKLSNRYEKLINSIWYKLYVIIARLALVVSVIFFVDCFLPRNTHNEKVVEISGKYNGILRNEVFLIKTNHSTKIFTDYMLKDRLSENDNILIQTTPILHSQTRIIHSNKIGHKSYDLDFSMYNYFPMVSLLLLIPYLIIRNPQKSYGFIFLVNISYSILIPFVLFFFITDLRLIKVFTLGFIQ
jgi:hypothetical protein